ncbi:MAG: TIGR03643 family protein [Cyclobacteriaceae bacterium]|nr:TIGR03643 family protein [Cyclobacteriaceae bacterium]
MAAIDTRFSQEDLDRIIQMAWEDRTPFEAIEMQFGLSESDVIRLVRASLKSSSFRMWRKRVNSRVSMKHSQKRNSEIKRFKSNRQRVIASNKISKR